MRSFHRLFESLKAALIEPPRHIRDVALYHKARLLNIFLIPMILVFIGVDVAYLATVPGYVPPWYGYVFLVGSYLLNRSRFYRFAPFIVLIMFPAVIFINIVSGDASNPLTTLNYLIPGLILSGILLSFQATVLFALVETVVILAMPYVAPGAFHNFETIVEPFSVIVISTVLVLVSMRSRDQIEKARQAELRDGEERLRLALDAARMGTWNWNIATGAVAWSETIEPMFGMKPGGFDGKYVTYLSLIHPDDLPIVQNAIEHTLTNKNADYFVEHRIVQPSGEIRWLEGRGRVYRDAKGTPIRMAGTVVDVTDRKRAEEALQEARGFLQQVLDTSPSMIFVIDDQGRAVFVNQYTAQYYGTTPEQLVAKSTEDVHRMEKEAQEFVSDDQEVIRTRQKMVKEELNTAPDGEQHWFYTVKVPLVKPDGTVEVLGISTDITDRKRAEEALRQAEEKYRNIVEYAVYGIFQSSPSGNYVSVNREMAKIYGYDSSQEMLDSITNIPSQIYADSSDRAAFISVLENEGTIYGFEARNRRKDGSVFWVSSNARVVKDAQGKILYYEGTVEDITLRKEVEAERERLLDELASKNAELERFVYTVSHDLKAPLVTIVGFLGYLEDDIEKGNTEHLRKDIERIYGAALRMQELLKDLLELSRVGRVLNKAETVSFDDLVSETLNLTEGRLQERSVSVHIESNLPRVHGDRQRLLEVVQNLIDNAAKNMGRQPDPLIEIGMRGFEDSKPVFFVRDNGIGIDPQYHEKIFGLFNKLDPSMDGTGVGLAIVKRIIEFHGGRIWVESEAGQGATFFFTLPPGENANPDSG